MMMDGRWEKVTISHVDLSVDERNPDCEEKKMKREMNL